jgi:hypothetical protein
MRKRVNSIDTEVTTHFMLMLVPQPKSTCGPLAPLPERRDLSVGSQHRKSFFTSSRMSPNGSIPLSRKMSRSYLAGPAPCHCIGPACLADAEVVRLQCALFDTE